MVCCDVEEKTRPDKTRPDQAGEEFGPPGWVSARVQDDDYTRASP